MKILFKSVTNACFTWNTRVRPVLSLDCEASEERELGQFADRTAGKPDQIAMCKELEQAVGEGLARLPPMQRVALELSSLDHSQEEIADILAITTGHVRVLVHRARQSMAEYLTPFTREAAG